MPEPESEDWRQQVGPVASRLTETDWKDLDAWKNAGFPEPENRWLFRPFSTSAGTLTVEFARALVEYRDRSPTEVVPPSVEAIRKTLDKVCNEKGNEEIKDAYVGLHEAALRLAQLMDLPHQVSSVAEAALNIERRKEEEVVHVVSRDRLPALTVYGNKEDAIREQRRLDADRPGPVYHRVTSYTLRRW